MLRGLTGKVAVITGGAGGIGSEVARRLGAEGCRLVIVDRDAGAADDLAKSLPAAIAVAADVSSVEGTASYLAAALDEFGTVDLFHNNAGIVGAIAGMVDLDPASFDSVISVNVRGTFLGLRAVLRQMRQQGTGGSIVNTSSIGGLVGTPGLTSYVASKHAVVGLTKVAAHEVGGTGIRVNAICPGIVDTAMTASFAAQAPQDGPNPTERIPLGRLATPSEIADLVAWLFSDESSYVHGSVIRVDGGMLS